MNGAGQKRARSQRVATRNMHERIETRGSGPRQAAGAKVQTASQQAPHIRLRSARRDWRRDAGLALPAVIAVFRAAPLRTHQNCSSVPGAAAGCGDGAVLQPTSFL